MKITDKQNGEQNLEKFSGESHQENREIDEIQFSIRVIAKILILILPKNFFYNHFRLVENAYQV